MRFGPSQLDVGLLPPLISPSFSLCHFISGALFRFLFVFLFLPSLRKDLVYWACGGMCAVVPGPYAEKFI